MVLSSTHLRCHREFFFFFDFCALFYNYFRVCSLSIVKACFKHLFLFIPLHQKTITLCLGILITKQELFSSSQFESHEKFKRDLYTLVSINMALFSALFLFVGYTLFTSVLCTARLKLVVS